MKNYAAAAFLLILLSTFLAAQTNEDGKNEFTVWGGFSPDSSTAFKFLGRSEDARFGIVALRYSRRFNNNDTVNLKYTADFVPATFLNYEDIEFPVNVAVFPPPVRRIRPTRYAFGAAPLGLQANFRPRKKIQPFVGLSGGFLYFNKRTPNFVGTHFAFTADVGGGVEFKMKENRAFTVGYKYYHISNADRGIQNPGFDNNVFYAGYTFFSK